MDFNNVPRPLSHIGCQDLLNMQPVYSGWLKYQVTLVREGLAKLPVFGVFIKTTVHKVRSPWIQKYVIIHNGCVYIFNNDTSIKPRTAFSLYLYNMVIRAQEFNDPKNCPWPFKLVHTNSKSQYLSASSQSEMKKWMSVMSTAMRKANNKPTCLRASRSSTASEESTYSDIEEPVYDSRDLRNMTRSEEIEINNDDETETDYVSYGEMAANGSIGDPSDPDDDEPDVPPASLPNMKVPVLPSMPGSFSDLDDIPMNPAPRPPLQPAKKTKIIDRVLPPIPTEIATTAYKNNWDKMPPPGVPSPRVPSPAVKPRPLPKTPRTPKTLPPPPQDDLVLAKWEGPKEQVKTTLIQLAKEGTFIIRDSASDDEQVLVVYVSGGIKQYKLHKRDGQFYLIENCSFNTKKELLNHYKNNFLPNTNNCLTKPYKFYNS